MGGAAINRRRKEKTEAGIERHLAVRFKIKQSQVNTKYY